MQANTFTHKGHEIQVVGPTQDDCGFYCKWDTGETRIMHTVNTAVYMAKKLIDAQEAQ